jgi:hypothetical protein
MTAASGSSAPGSSSVSKMLPGLIRRAARIGLASLVLCLPLPSLLGVANSSYLLVTILGVGLIVGLSRLEGRAQRPVFLELFGIAFSIRLVALGLPNTETRTWRFGYVAYWGALSVIAMGHIAARRLASTS